MTTGVAVFHFGEPPEPELDRVRTYLERIFLANARLSGDDDEAAARERSRKLAERRAPSLIEEYEAIGGSPLNEQATAQAAALESVLQGRGYDVTTYVGMQFADPLIETAVERARADGVDRLVGLPVYPLCGPSTTVASLDDFSAAVDAADWAVDTSAVSGWHRHPRYTGLRAGNVRSFLADRDLDPNDPDTALVFSAHGTPTYYLDRGSRYVEYVEEFCEALAASLGIADYELGYQNHENRGVEWTQPDVEDVIETVDAERVVVEPVSFMHEQSETLSELDVELREEAQERGLEFHRVPVPHDDERFASVLADVVEPFLAGFDPGYYRLAPCQCRDAPDTFCLNAPARR
jgi:ferrochelatase